MLRSQPIIIIDRQHGVRRMKLLKNALIHRVGVLVPFIILFVPNSASAQEPFNGILEEITVTAQKRAESLQDVSVSVSVLSGEKLVETGITKIEDLQAFVPNLSYSETGIGTNIFLRGIGSGINQGFEQSVGTFTDGVYNGRAQLSRAPFLDLARVEVLRGPQSVLFGKDAIAGAVSLTTAQPTDEFEASVGVTAEPRFDENILDVVVSGPLTENLTGRIAHRSRLTEGYVDNLDGGDEPERDEHTTRVILNWDAGGNFDASLKYEIGRFDVSGRQIEIIGDAPSLNPALGGATWAEFLLSLNPLNAVTGASQTPLSVLNTELDFNRSSNGDFSNNDTDSIGFTFNYAFGDYTLTSTTAYVGYEYEELCDCDFSSANVFFVRSDEEYSQFSQEFRVTSPLGGKVEWIAGGYYQDSDLEFDDVFFTEADSVLGNVLDAILSADTSPFGGTFPAGGAQQLNGLSVPRVFRQDAEVFSGFAQATWNISDVYRLTVGGRLAREDKEATRTLTYTDSDGNELPIDEGFFPNASIGIDNLLGAALQVERHDLAGDRRETNFAPSINFEWDFLDDALFYASWARGFKSGGYDVRSNTAPFALDGAGNPIQTVIENPIADVEIPEGAFEFDQEQADNFELGVKTRLFGGRVELNASAFYTEYEDLQVSQFDGVLSFNVVNAAEAEVIGLEVDGRWAINDNFSLSGAFSLLDFEFQDFDNGQCTQELRITEQLAGQPIPTCDFDSFSNQYVADFSGAVSLGYFTPIGNRLVFNSALDVLFTTEYNPSANLDPDIEQDGYAKLNLRLAVGDIDDSWEIAILGRNLTDEDIVTFANDVPLSANLTQNAGFYGFVESPRTIAVQGVLRF